MEQSDILSIQQASQLLNIAPSTLRYWEKEGLIGSNRDAENDYRKYSIHDLIEASDVAFYRQLGVPVKTLKHARELTYEALDDVLEETQAITEQKIIELENIKSRIVTQRSFVQKLKRLENTPLREEDPPTNKLYALNYNDAETWDILTYDQMYYGVIIEASTPQTVIDTILDTPCLDDTECIWSADVSRALYLECLLKVKTDDCSSNAESLFADAKKNGYKPIRIIGLYLITAKEELRWDYYQAWIECARRDDNDDK